MTEEQKQVTRKRIGQRIAELRSQHNMTQQQLADKTGLIRAHISRIEQGRYSVGFDTLQLIADAFGYRIEFINNKIMTMEKLAEYINESDEWPLDVEDIIEANNWVSDTHTQWGVCHDASSKIILDDEGKAQVVNL
jgi:transcriptional regulator with XRE-family HTH domain